ncbi:hypothetical protein F441_06154 [Phytophthora nicotianae CJ01A1]|nr:hypothetical protein F441_06154 [Phytophthora nicotianae CJ01A1]
MTSFSVSLAPYLFLPYFPGKTSPDVYMIWCNRTDNYATICKMNSNNHIMRPKDWGISIYQSIWLPSTLATSSQTL